MKQYKVKLIGKYTNQIGIRHIHANNIQEAGEKAEKHYLQCEVVDVYQQ